MSSANEPSNDPSGSSHAAASSASSKQQRLRAAHHRHFRRNMRLTLALLFVWAMVGLGCGVLFADVLNQYRFLGFPLGFWFAQQGAILTFVLLILIYALGMARLDQRLANELQSIQAEEDQS
jgi:putative solute:sodium symporter small subunit